MYTISSIHKLAIMCRNQKYVNNTYRQFNRILIYLVKPKSAYYEIQIATVGKLY